MATSDAPEGTSHQPTEAFVWVWLPGAVDPVVAGRAWQAGHQGLVPLWPELERADAIALFPPELPLGADPIAPLAGLSIAGCLNDGPDAWGQRVILHRRLGRRSAEADTAELTPITYHTWRRERRGDVDRGNAPGRDRGADADGVQNAGDRLISHVLRAAGHLGRAVGAGNGITDAHGTLSQ
jgi:hypothetical protein